MPSKSFEDLLQEFAVFLHVHERAENTVKSYQRDLRGFNRWFEGSNGEEALPPHITPIDVREFKSHLLTVANQKPATVNRKLASLSVFCQWAKAEGVIDDNPTEHVSQVASAETGVQWLNKKEQYALLRAVQKEGAARDIAIITLLLHTGLRVSELSSLKIEDLDMSERKGQLIVRQGKGRKYRSVPLNVEARRALEVLLVERPQLQHEYLLWGSRSGPLKSWGIQHVLRKYAYRAQLEDVTPHRLRHTFGKNLVDAGVPIEQVAMLMGHANIETTRRYVTPGMVDLQHAVSQLELS